MPSSAVFARGTALRVGDGATPTENFTTIPEVFGLKGPNLVQDMIEVTNHDSTQGFKEYIGGLLEGGEVTFSINYQPSNTVHIGVRADLLNRTRRNYQVVFPGAAAWAFTGYLTKFDETASEKDRLTADCAIKISGPVS